MRPATYVMVLQTNSYTIVESICAHDVVLNQAEENIPFMFPLSCRDASMGSM